MATIKGPVKICLIAIVTLTCLLFFGFTRTNIFAVSQDSTTGLIKQVHTATKHRSTKTLSELLGSQRTHAMSKMDPFRKMSNTSTFDKASIRAMLEFYEPKYLPKDVMKGIKLFVFFIGYPRSGGSIVGSLLDAHPNAIIAHELDIFNWAIDHKFSPSLYIKYGLFQAIYRNSYDNRFRNGTRTSNRKGYNLTIEESYQGQYRDRVDVIGDKKGGKTSTFYSTNSTLFKKLFLDLKQSLSMPIKVIHCVRNPFDMVAKTLYYISSRLEPNVTDNHAVLNEIMSDQTDKLLSRATAVSEFKQFAASENVQVLDIHNYDLVVDTEKTMMKLCRFLGLECDEDYLKMCKRKVYPELSRSRFMFNWPENQKTRVNEIARKFSFFEQYSFDGPL